MCKAVSPQVMVLRQKSIFTSYLGLQIGWWM